MAKRQHHPGSRVTFRVDGLGGQFIRFSQSSKVSLFIYILLTVKALRSFFSRHLSLSRHQTRPPVFHHVVYSLEFQQDCPQGLFRVHFSILLSALLSCKGTLCPTVTTSKSHCPSLFPECVLYAVTVLSLPETCTTFNSSFRNLSSPELLILHKTLVFQLDCLKFYLCHHKAIKLVLA